jgi:hypothetical protein
VPLIVRSPYSIVMGVPCFGNLSCGVGFMALNARYHPNDDFAGAHPEDGAA